MDSIYVTRVFSPSSTSQVINDLVEDWLSSLYRLIYSLCSCKSLKRSNILIGSILALVEAQGLCFGSINSSIQICVIICHYIALEEFEVICFNK